MKKKNGPATDWKLAGRLQAYYISLHSLVMETLKKSEVGMEILRWLTKEGQDHLIRMVEKLVKEFKHWQKLPLTATIDLDGCTHWDVLPDTYVTRYSDTYIMRHLDSRSGQATIEKRRDGFGYLNGKRLSLGYLTHEQLNNPGHQVSEEIRKQGWNVPGLALLKFYRENPDFWPEDWKRNEFGSETVYVFFFGSMLAYIPDHDPDRLSVACGKWNDGEVEVNKQRLVDNWYENFLPAVIEEE